MSSDASTTDSASDRSYREYVLDVRIVEADPESGGVGYRFDAPDHVGVAFDDPSMATLYADVYFAVNGFVEADTGDRGVPPEIVVAGKHTLAAYLVTRTSVSWVASFYGADPARIERYVSRVRAEAEEVRAAIGSETEGADRSG